MFVGDLAMALKYCNDADPRFDIKSTLSRASRTQWRLGWQSLYVQSSDSSDLCRGNNSMLCNLLATLLLMLELLLMLMLATLPCCAMWTRVT